MQRHLAARLLMGLFLLFALAGGATRELLAAEELPVARVLDEQAWVLVRIRPERLQLAEVYRLLAPVRGLQLPEQAAMEMLSARFLKAGGREIFIVWGGEAPAFLFVPTPAEADKKALSEVLTAAELGQVLTIESSIELPGGIAAGQRSVLTHLQSLQAKPREHLARAIEATVDSAIQVLFLPTDQNREAAAGTVWTFLPKDRTSSLVESLGWGSIGIDAPPKPRLKIALASRDEQWIELLKTVLFLTATPYIQFAGEAKNEALTDHLRRILTFKQDGNMVSIDVNDDNLDLSMLGRGLVQPAVEQITLRAVNSLTINNLKQLGLAMHNYHDAMKRFPAPAVLDDAKTPLLSWRVTLLPYLEDGNAKLHDEFHLDEPWDSEHNRTLIARIPSVYRSPVSRAPAGYTNYLGVTGTGMTFEGPDGIPIRQVIDGTSNTLGIVEVDDRHAVAWTKPEDWKFDLVLGSKGLGGALPGRFTALGLDGAVHTLKTNTAPGVLHSLFTYGGREPQSFPD